MRILHVVGSLAREWGGLSLFVAEMAAEQASAGHAVTLLTQDRPGRGGCWDAGLAIVVSAADSTMEELVRESAVVHVHGLWLPFHHQAARLARKYRRAHVISTHGMLEPEALRFSRWKKRLAWALYQRHDLACAPLLHATTAVETRSIRAHGFKQAVVEVPPGVRVSATPSRGSGPRVALFLGRIHPMKGIDRLIDAWAEVRPQGWRLVLAGPDEGGHWAQVAARIQAAGMAGQIEWLGPVFDATKERVLNEAHLLVIPSLSENFGIVVAEGLAHGLPVLTTTGTPWQCLTEERCGWWVEPTVAGIAAALKSACTLDSNTLQDMGQRGRLLAETHFRWDCGARQLLAAYDGLAQTSLTSLE